MGEGVDHSIRMSPQQLSDEMQQTLGALDSHDLELARRRYAEASPSAQRRLKLSLGELIKPRPLVLPVGWSAFPVITRRGYAVIIELRFSLGGSSDALPPALRTPIERALSDERSEILSSELSLSVLPPIEVDQWRSHPGLHRPALKLRGESFGGALYVAVRSLLSARSDSILRVITGHLKDDHIFSCDDIELQIKRECCHQRGLELFSAQGREPIFEWYERHFRQQRTLSSLERDLDDHSSLDLSDRHQLLYEVINALQTGRLEGRIIGDDRRIFYVNTRALAAHLGLWSSLPSDIKALLCKDQGHDPAERILDLCFELNAHVMEGHTERLEGWVKEQLTAISEREPGCDFLDLSPHSDTLMHQPVYMSYLWRTFARFLLARGEHQRAQALSEHALYRTLQSEEAPFDERARALCEHGRLLGVLGEAQASLEYLERCQTYLDDPEMRDHEETQQIRPFSDVYMGRALAQLGEVDSALAYLSSHSERGSAELKFLRCESRYLIAFHSPLYLYEADLSWGQLTERTLYEERGGTWRQIIDRVEKAREIATQDPHSRPLRPTSLYRIQRETRGLCSPF